tara:strand:+ start:439 stop:642 length:204 start_codon:yes stop_codon:yes gene_type:complete
MLQSNKVLNDLIKLSDSLDKRGLHAEANLIDNIIRKLSGDHNAVHDFLDEEDEDDTSEENPPKKVSL